MSKLYIIPTPIGNLEDITYRAARILNEVDVILAEDTRQTKKLLNHYQIDKKIVSYHQYNEHQITQNITRQIQNGIIMALVSDAGTPGISDPGFMLVRACLQENIDIECLPGATAFVPALVNSGFPCERFCFEGFLPHKKGRHTRLKQLAEEERTMVFYESPHRLVKALEQFMEYFGPDRNVSVSRELTKIHEENRRGSLKEVFEYYKSKNVKGEIVIVLEGSN